MSSPSGDVAVPRWRRFRWRGAVFVAVAVCGLIGFASGVGTTQRPEVAAADTLAQLYYALGLFIFGGMDLGTPIGGPLWGRGLLWLSYFAAPAITASAVVETVMRLVQPQSFILRRRRGHIVVAGCGRLTHLYLERLRRQAPQVPVLVVGDPSEVASFDELRDVFRAEVLVGDIASDAVLRKLRLDAAIRLLLLTDDDFTNLDAAARILELAPGVQDRLIVHVSDLNFMRTMEPTHLARSCRVFNGHQIAATHLVQTQILDHFRRTEPADTVVLAGFGRFGQTVLAQLQAKAAGAFARVVIVDLEATRRTGIFAEQVGFVGNYQREVVDGDIRDPDVWRRVEATIDAGAVEPVLVVGSGLDRINLRIAMALGRRYPEALVLARSERRWAFAEVFSAEAGIHTLSVAELVTQSMPNRWFSAGDEVDESADAWSPQAGTEQPAPAER